MYASAFYMRTRLFFWQLDCSLDRYFSKWVALQLLREQEWPLTRNDVQGSCCPGDRKRSLAIRIHRRAAGLAGGGRGGGEFDRGNARANRGPAKSSSSEPIMTPCLTRRGPTTTPRLSPCCWKSPG